MRSWRLVALLVVPVAVLAAMLVLALPRRMNAVSEDWARARGRGVALTTASLVAADLDFDDRVHAAESLAVLAAQSDVVSATLTTADGVFARWPDAAPPARGGTMVVKVSVGGQAGARGELTVVFSTVALDAQTAANTRTAWLIALAVLVVGGFASLAAMAAIRRATRHTVQREVAAEFERLVEDLPEAVVVRRADVVVFANARARELFGLADRGGSLAAMSTPSLGDLPEHQVAEIAARGGRHQVEVARKPVMFGGLAAELVSVRDVTDREGMRTRLDVSQRLASVGSLAAGVAHEINNPLTVIAMNLEMIGDQLPEHDDEGVRMVADAADATERVRRIVADMRGLARGDDERVEPIDVADAVARAIQLSAAEVRMRAQVVVGPSTAQLWAIGSESRLVQVLVNVLVNAAHAMPPGRDRANAIRVEASRAGDAIEVRIVDNGVGMTPHVLDRAFDPFFTTKAVGVGTGMGLSICHNLMRAMGGAIALASTVDVGTTVTLQLPVAPADARPAPRPRTSRLGRAVSPVLDAARRRILVVDDEPAIRWAASRILTDYAVTTAESGLAALESIHHGDRFDLIVCDILMPEMAGPALRSRLEDVAPDQARRMVFMTGGVDHRAQGTAGGADVLRKPFSKAELAAFVASSVNRLA